MFFVVFEERLMEFQEIRCIYSAIRHASIEVSAFSLLRIFWRWRLTVWMLMESSMAISLLILPALINCRTSFSRVTQRSQYVTGVKAEYGEELLTLSTCAYHTEEGRFVVVAKRVK